jgi:general stress protein 26
MNGNQRAVPAMRRLLDGMSIGMLTTSGADGKSRGRPMLLQEVDQTGHIWLMTDRGSGKTEDIAENPAINLSVVSRRQDRFVSISGVATMRRDERKIHELWKASYRAWYPRGRTDPSLVLLEVEVSHIDYWLVPTSRLVRLLNAFKALATRRRYESGEHGTIVFQA